MPDQPRPRVPAATEFIDLAVQASSSAEREEILKHLREELHQDDAWIATALADQAGYLHRQSIRLRGGIAKLKVVQEKQGQLIKKLTGPALHPAVFHCLSETGETTLAVISNGSSFRAVHLAPELDPESLVRGDQVLLSEQMNIILHKTPPLLPQGSDIAAYHSTLPSGQLVLEAHDQQLLVHPAACLPVEKLKRDDRITYDRDSKMAFAIVPQTDSDHLFLHEEPKNSWSDIGGMKDAKADLKNAATLIRDHPDLTREYGLRQVRGMVIYGPPGNGKSMSLQAFAKDLGADSVMYLRPGELNRMYFGESEKRVRMIFRELRRRAERNPEKFVMLAIEEIDSLCGTRGKLGSHHSDKVQNAILAEIEGMTERGNIVIVGTTNRFQDLDPAIVRPGRLGDRIINVSRPGRQDAQQVLALHMADIQRFAETGNDLDETRSLIIEAVLDRIYSPHGLGPVANLKFQDNSQREVLPRDLVSGAILAKIKADAAEKACLRHMAGGCQGVQLDDFLASVDDEILRMAKVLAPENCGSYLDDLPQDNRVVAVTTTDRKAVRFYEIMRSA